MDYLIMMAVLVLVFVVFCVGIVFTYGVTSFILELLTRVFSECSCSCRNDCPCRRSSGRGRSD